MKSLVKKTYLFLFLSVGVSYNIHPAITVPEFLSTGLSWGASITHSVCATMTQYPKLTAAFTVLSCFAINEAQRIAALAKALHASRKELALLKEAHCNHQQENKLSTTEENTYKALNRQHTQASQLLEENQALLKKLQKEEEDVCKTMLSQKFITVPPPKIREVLCNNRKKRNYKGPERWTTVEELPAVHYKNELNAELKNRLTTLKKQNLELEKAIQEKADQLEKHKASDELQKCIKNNKATALKIFQRSKTDINGVLKNAELVADTPLPSPSNDNNADCRALKSFKNNLLILIEQLQSIIDRYKKTFAEFDERYKRTMQAGPLPHSLYETVELTTIEGICASAQEIMQKAEILKKADRDVYRALENVLCSGRGFPGNPLAKENFDAYLLGEEELKRIKPTLEEYNSAYILKKKLEKKLYDVEPQFQDNLSAGARLTKTLDQPTSILSLLRSSPKSEG